MKRMFDLVLSIPALFLLSPFLLFVGLAVKMDSPGAAFFVQQRIGRNGVPFGLFKFRTMHINADRLAAITVGSRDPRITRVGYYLRKFKIDELPQLINVVLGQMSLVGPRPELKKFVDLYSPEQLKVLTVRPGITDLASIKFKDENNLLEGKPDPVKYYIDEIMPVKLEMALKYVESRSLVLDLQIILKTIFGIVKK